MLHLSSLQVLADIVTDDHLAEGRLYPPLRDVRNVSIQIAAGVIDYAYRHNLASTYPEPQDKIAFIQRHMYNTDYESFIPETYAWPGMVD